MLEAGIPYRATRAHRESCPFTGRPITWALTIRAEEELQRLLTAGGALLPPPPRDVTLVERSLLRPRRGHDRCPPSGFSSSLLLWTTTQPVAVFLAPPSLHVGADP